MVRWLRSRYMFIYRIYHDTVSKTFTNVCWKKNTFMYLQSGLLRGGMFFSSASLFWKNCMQNGNRSWSGGWRTMTATRRSWSCSPSFGGTKKASSGIVTGRWPVKGPIGRFEVVDGIPFPVDISMLLENRTKVVLMVCYHYDQREFGTILIIILWLKMCHMNCFSN